MKNINWNAIAVILPAAIIIIGWGVSIEIRLRYAIDITGRLEKIEESLRPLLVDYEVKRELISRGVIQESSPPVVIPGHSHPEYHPPDDISMAVPPAPVEDGWMAIPPAPNPDPVYAPGETLSADPLSHPEPPSFEPPRFGSPSRAPGPSKADWNNIKSKAMKRADDQIQAIRN